MLILLLVTVGLLVFLLIRKSSDSTGQERLQGFVFDRDPFGLGSDTIAN